jgi:hypothetical protein
MNGRTSNNSMNHLYTLVAGYQGFSGITQHRGVSIQEALEDWVRSFPFALLATPRLLSTDQIEILKRDIPQAKLVSHHPEHASMWFVYSNLGKQEPVPDGVFRIEIIDTVMPEEPKLAL